MNLFRRNTEPAAPEADPRFGLSRDELNASMAALPGDALSEEFADGEHWPTEGLSDRQIDLLSAKLRKVRDRDARLGKLGLK